MKKSLIAAALAGAVAACLAACSVPSVDVAEPKEAPAVAEESPSPEPAAEPAAGTLANPGPAGSSIESVGLDGTTYTTVVASVVNPANDLVAQTNQFNAAAPAGFHYVVVTVSITNTSADAAKAVLPGSAAYDLAVVDEATGQSYAQTFAVLPNDLTGQPDIYTGQTATGDVAFLVPDSVSSLLVASGGVFVRI